MKIILVLMLVLQTTIKLLVLSVHIIKQIFIIRKLLLNVKRWGSKTKRKHSMGWVILRKALNKIQAKAGTAPKQEVHNVSR